MGYDTQGSTTQVNQVTESADFDLHRDGFTILRGVYSREQVQAARDLVVDVIAYAERGLEDPFQPYYLKHRSDQGVLYDVVQRHPQFWEFVRAPRVLDALASKLGDDILMYENSVVYKPKGRRNAVPYHQDFISRPNEPLKLIAWTAFEPITVATGAMKVFPGSHTDGFLPWYRVQGETHHDRIRPEKLPTTEPIAAELGPGDVMIFNQLLVHGSDEVHTDSLRIAFRASYQGFEEIYVPRGAPVVVSGGRPQALASRFPAQAVEPKRPSFMRRAARYVGRRLIRLTEP